MPNDHFLSDGKKKRLNFVKNVIRINIFSKIHKSFSDRKKNQIKFLEGKVITLKS